MIIHLIRPARGTNARRTFIRRGATIPEDFIGPAALPLFCLAPHGVFRASRIAPRAVSSYLAFSPLPALFSKNRRCVFCDTFRQRPSGCCRTNVARVFYAACCRMVFGLSSSKRYGSPAIICHRRINYHKNRNLEATKPMNQESRTSRWSGGVMELWQAPLHYVIAPLLHLPWTR